MKSVAQLLKSKVMSVVSISPNATVYEGIKALAENEIGAILVMEGQELVGIFSERDYARKVILAGKSSKETKIRDIMTSKVLWVSPDQTNEECMALMTAKKIRHLPVLEHGTVVGVLSIGDLVKDIINEQEFTIKQLEHYIHGKSEIPSYH